MKTAGLVLDFYDDKGGETLKSICPTPESLPECVKVAHLLSSEERSMLRDEAFALILHSDDGHMRKFACVDEGNTALSTIYFLENAEKLPAEAIKTAAQNLIAFNQDFGLDVPPDLVLAAETGMPVKEKTAIIGPLVDIANFGVPSGLGYVVGKDEGRKMRDRGEKLDEPSMALGAVVPGYIGYRFGKRHGYEGSKGKKKHSSGSVKLAVKGGMGRKRNTDDQPYVGDEADWAQRTNLISVRGGADSGRVIPTANQMKTASQEWVGVDPSIYKHPKIKALHKKHGTFDHPEIDDLVLNPHKLYETKLSQAKTAMLGSSGISIPKHIPRVIPAAPKLTGKALATATSKAEADFWKRGPKSATAPIAKAKAASVERKAKLYETARKAAGSFAKANKEQGVKSVKDALAKNPKEVFPQAGLLSPFSNWKHVQAHVDVSKLEPKHVEKAKVASRTALNGGYSLDSYSDVTDAITYFSECWPEMDPTDRHEFCVKTASRADELGIKVPELMDRYGSTEYAPDVEAHLANRRQVDPAHSIVWDDLQEKRAMIEPETFAELLKEADQLFNLDVEWGGAVADPYYATFGGRGQEKLAWASETQDGVSITEQDLRSIPQERIQENFAPDFAEAFAADPTTIFDSMPADTKQVLARMARDA